MPEMFKVSGTQWQTKQNKILTLWGWQLLVKPTPKYHSQRGTIPMGRSHWRTGGVCLHLTTALSDERNVAPSLPLEMTGTAF